MTAHNATDTEHTTRLTPSSSDSARHTTDTDQRENEKTERREREARREREREEGRGGVQGGRRGGDGESVMDEATDDAMTRDSSRRGDRRREMAALLLNVLMWQLKTKTESGHCLQELS